ncbi:SDR family NAD(P)-dependent oxidoreductase [soil metagenome]
MTRHAVVIGGASGIGWAVAQTLRTDGFTVVIADRNTDGARERAAELGAPHSAATVDVVDEASVQALFEGSSPDVVVNCAGFSGLGPITDLAVEQFREVVDVCLTGAFLVLKHAGQRMGDGGAIVSLTSLNARQPAVGMSAYCSAKAGLAMLTQVAALEFGPRGIRVNAVSPGFVPTPLTAPAALIPGVVEEYVENTPLGRTGTPQDIADAVAFLCSDKSSWMTGEVIDLNGGAHLKRYPNIVDHVMKFATQPH